MLISLMNLALSTSTAAAILLHNHLRIGLMSLALKAEMGGLHDSRFEMEID